MKNNKITFLILIVVLTLLMVLSVSVASAQSFSERYGANVKMKSLDQFSQFHKNNTNHKKYIGQVVFMNTSFGKTIFDKNESAFLRSITDASKPLYAGIPLAATYLDCEAYEEGYLQFKVAANPNDFRIFDRQKIKVNGFDRLPFVSFPVIPTEKEIENISYTDGANNYVYHAYRNILINAIQAATPEGRKVKLGEYEYPGAGTKKLFFHVFVVDYTVEKSTLPYGSDRYVRGYINIDTKNIDHWKRLFTKLRSKEIGSQKMSRRTKRLADHEAALAKRFKSEYGPEGWVASEIRVTGSGYTIQKNNFDVPVRKLIKMEVAAKNSKDGRCYVFQFNYGKGYSGGGNYDGAFNGATIGGWEISCKNMPK